nr:26S proteasome non-ATPase regulatory subunit 12 homolog A-like [Tanacetum cinerariifolium]
MSVAGLSGNRMEMMARWYGEDGAATVGLRWSGEVRQWCGFGGGGGGYPKEAYIEMDFPNILSQEDRQFIEREVSIDEIKKAVWDCWTDKAPGLDGFTFGFYRRYWDLIHGDVTNAVKYFFTHCDIPHGYIETKIDLIKTLNSVSAEKFFVKIDRAQFIKWLTKIKEEQGEIAKDADLMQKMSVRIYLFNLEKTLEKIEMAARVITAIEFPQDIIVQSSRPYGQRDGELLKLAAMQCFTRVFAVICVCVYEDSRRNWKAVGFGTDDVMGLRLLEVWNLYIYDAKPSGGGSVNDLDEKDISDIDDEKQKMRRKKRYILFALSLNHV